MVAPCLSKSEAIGYKQQSSEDLPSRGSPTRKQIGNPANQLLKNIFRGSAAVAQSTVNRLVGGSNPPRGAKLYVASSSPQDFAR